MTPTGSKPHARKSSSRAPSKARGGALFVPGRPRAPVAPVRTGPVATAAQVTRTITEAVAGLRYELVDIERAARGLLRVTIDRMVGQAYEGDAGEFITVEDCERVTRQLQYALEVEGADYARLEVSSPGLDRPLRTEADYQRFAGQEVSITLKLPFEGRKHWRGVLQMADAGWSLHLVEGKAERVLGFVLSEVREARLVPVLNFKGRKTTDTAVNAEAGQE